MRRRGPPISERLSYAVPALRKCARSASRRWGRPPPEEAFQIALTASHLAEGRFREELGVAFETFVQMIGLRAIRDVVKTERHVPTAAAVFDGMVEFAASIPDAGDGFYRTDAQNKELLDDLNFSVAASAFLAVARPPKTPEQKLIAAQRREHVLGVLREVMAKLPDEDRQIVEAHVVEGRPLEEARVGVTGWSALTRSTARRRFDEVVASIGRRMAERQVTPESVQAMLAER